MLELYRLIEILFILVCNFPLYIKNETTPPKIKGIKKAFIINEE